METEGAHIKRPQTLGEEIANSISHGIGLLLALAAVPVLIIAAVHRGSALSLVGACVYATTLVLLYSASTIYHALPPNRAKRVFQVCDHAAVFLLIAGTYTPFTLGVLHGAWGWTLLALVWSLALLGVSLKTVGVARYPRLSMCLYLTMGWLVLIAVREVWLHVPVYGLAWLFAGGLAYTFGVGFYAAERVRYNHLVWHLFVLMGSICHLFAVLWYSA
jgi:hemolysin III